MFEKIGNAVISKVSSVPYVFGYIGRVVASALNFFKTEKAARKVLVMQLLFTFIEALPLIAVLALALGAGLYLIGYTVLLSMGQQNLIFNLLIMIITRELGPVLVAFIVIARSATAIATELAGMVTTHQIESYISVGVDPLAHLAAPRFIGVTLSVFFLNLYFSLCGLLGAALVVRIFNPLAASIYFDGLLTSLSVSVIFISILKSLIFGMVIALVSTYYGFGVDRASTEVPVAGISAVGKSIVYVIIADVLITVLSYIF